MPHAARLKTPKPGCTLSLPVVMVTSLLITTACFHWDSSGLWNWLIFRNLLRHESPLLSNLLRASLLVVWQLNDNCTLWSTGWSIHACLLNCTWKDTVCLWLTRGKKFAGCEIAEGWKMLGSQQIGRPYWVNRVWRVNSGRLYGG